MKTTCMRSGVAILAIAISLLLPLSPILAEQNGHANVTFTKWGTQFTDLDSLDMEGVVSGDVGGGRFIGEANFLPSSDPNILVIDAFYHINGGIQQFTAHNLITQDLTTGRAVIEGVVIDGWLNGAKVDGEYQVIFPCGIINAQEGAIGDVCFQGTLRVHGGGGS
jgi:hypothetical protein